MNVAQRSLMKDRPEEYQEYRGYQRKYQQLTVQFMVACAVALSVIVGVYLLWSIVPALVLAVIALGILIWLYRSQSHTRSTLRLSMALMQLTFDDPSEVSQELKDELTDIFRQD